MATTTTCSRTAGQLGRKRWITWQLWCVLLWQLCAGVEHRIKKDQVKVYPCAPCEIAMRTVINFNSTDWAQNGLEPDFPKASQIFQDIRSCERLIFPGPKDFSLGRIVTIANHYWSAIYSDKPTDDRYMIYLDQWIRRPESVLCPFCTSKYIIERQPKLR